jgi:hypothetical protein
MIEVLIAGLGAGDVRFYNGLTFLTWPKPPGAWAVALKGAYNLFVEAAASDQGITDDDVPF